MDQEKKIKVLVHTDHSKMSTGFGRHGKYLLKYLYKKGIEVVEMASGGMYKFEGDERLKYLPWKGYGSAPADESFIQKNMGDPQMNLGFCFGAFSINDVIRKEKPTHVININDSWNVQYLGQPWINKIHFALWTPIDSLPLLDNHIECAKTCKNMWVKADFAQKELHKLGFEHVKFMPALIDQKPFKIMPRDEQIALRRHFGIPEDCVLFGYVFRNQLRKLVGTLIDGFAIFKQENPNVNSKLWLHTSFAEGWDIPKLIRQNNINPADVLVTHVCRACKTVKVIPFTQLEIDCDVCNTRIQSVGEDGKVTEKPAMTTTSPDNGVTEDQLCMLYNLLYNGAFVFPSNSGGFEMPIQESLLCGNLLATVDYSYGTLFTEHPLVEKLDYLFYREMGSQFFKAQPDPKSIAAFMKKVAEMPQEEKDRIGRELRDYFAAKFDPDKICESVYQWIVDNPPTDYNYEFSDGLNENYQFNKDIVDDGEWIKDLYKGVLKTDLAQFTDEFKGALQEIKNCGREKVYNDIIDHARQLNESKKKRNFSDFFDKNSEKKKLAYVIPDSFGDCLASTAVLEGLKEKYPLSEWDYYIVTRPHNFTIFSHLDYIKNLVPYQEGGIMEDFGFWEGKGEHLGVVDVVFIAHTSTQLVSNYTHNGF